MNSDPTVYWQYQLKVQQYLNVFHRKCLFWNIVQTVQFSFVPNRSRFSLFTAFRINEGEQKNYEQKEIASDIRTFNRNLATEINKEGLNILSVVRPARLLVTQNAYLIFLEVDCFHSV